MLSCIEFALEVLKLYCINILSLSQIIDGVKIADRLNLLTEQTRRSWIFE